MSPPNLSFLVAPFEDELIALRRDLHAHPELSWAEVRTTNVVRSRLQAAGMKSQTFSRGTGLMCDVGDGGPLVALRADIDALAVNDLKSVPYRSTVEGVCHACGHDVHTAVVLGAGLVLEQMRRAGKLPGRVRLIFQPAEESMPSGALEIISSGALEGVNYVFGLHCNPQLPLGQIGVRPGAITAACDKLSVQLKGPGGHTARPHLTADLVYAAAKVITDLPAVLSRRIDPRAGVSLVWGAVNAGSAANAIPETGVLLGTLRSLDSRAWHDSPELIKELVEEITAPYGVHAVVEQTRGVPPVVNDLHSVSLMTDAVRGELGEEAVVVAEQSMGGDDFGWYLEEVPGCFARLGVGCPGDESRDIHQGTFDVDERCIAVGVRTLVASALLALDDAS